MPLNQEETEGALREMCADVATYAREAMAKDGRSVTSIALVITPDTIAVVPVLDVSQHLSMLRDAVTKVQGTGLLFAHDGWITVDEGARADALLIVWASMWGSAEGAAHTYERTSSGVRFLDVLPAQPQHLAVYQRVFVQSS